MARLNRTIDPEQAIALAKSSDATPAGVTRVVVIGGGFAGVFTAKHLTELVGKRSDVEVELLSEENHFVFQPLLPEVAAGGIDPTHVVNPIRALVPKARFRCCRVVAIDSAQKRVLVLQGEGTAIQSIPYDHLVIAIGKVTSFASMPGVAEHAFAMKDLADAYRLRNHVIRCLELADIEPDPAQKKALLTFVVAGGGFSGVETMGELHELVERSLRYFPRVKKHELSFVLVHSQDRILPEMPEPLSASAKKVLEKRGIEIRLGARVRAASRDFVHLGGNVSIPTRTFVCTIGNASNPLVRDLLDRQGFAEAKIEGKAIGIVLADETLACVGKPGHWAVGDCAGIPNLAAKGFCPPTAQFAIREAKTCARNILAAIDGKPSAKFVFKALGILASLGQRRAVAEVMGIHLTGFIAWFFWRTVYLMKLPGLLRKLRVALDWTIDLFFERDITQMRVASPPRLTVQHFEPGEVIVEKGEIGRELFVIVSGQVEVEERNVKLGPRDVFGELALLQDVPRNATVRATVPTDVLVVSRRDFRSMIGVFPVLEDYFAKLLHERHPAKMPAQSSVSQAMAS